MFPQGPLPITSSAGLLGWRPVPAGWRAAPQGQRWELLQAVCMSPGSVKGLMSIEEAGFSPGRGVTCPGQQTSIWGSVLVGPMPGRDRQCSTSL